MCDYEGEALFLDADMLCLTDITKIEDENHGARMYVVKDGVEKFEWPSLMLFNNTYCEELTPEWIDNPKNSPQKWVFENAYEHGLDKEWNHIVPYSGENPTAKIVHFTQGIPCWEETRDCEYGDEWIEEFQSMNSSCGFEELMGSSVHKQRMVR